MSQPKHGSGASGSVPKHSAMRVQMVPQPLALARNCWVYNSAQFFTFDKQDVGSGRRPCAIK